jgi:hypothetical protein
MICKSLGVSFEDSGVIRLLTPNKRQIIRRSFKSLYLAPTFDPTSNVDYVADVLESATEDDILVQAILLNQSPSSPVPSPLPLTLNDTPVKSSKSKRKSTLSPSKQSVAPVPPELPIIPTESSIIPIESQIIPTESQIIPTESSSVPIESSTVPPESSIESPIVSPLLESPDILVDKSLVPSVSRYKQTPTSTLKRGKRVFINDGKTTTIGHNIHKVPNNRRNRVIQRIIPDADGYAKYYPPKKQAHISSNQLISDHSLEIESVFT